MTYKQSYSYTIKSYISYHYYLFLYFSGFKKGNLTVTSFPVKMVGNRGIEPLQQAPTCINNCWHSLLGLDYFLLCSTIKLVPHIERRKMIYYRPSPYQRFNLHLYSTTEKISLSIGSYPNTSYPKRVICRRSLHRINQMIHYSTNSWRIDYLQLSPTIQIIC